MPIKICHWPHVVDPVGFALMSWTPSGGEVYALSEMADHMSLLRDFFDKVGGLDPGMARLEDCESHCTYLRTKKMTAEEYLVQHFRVPSRPWKKVNWVMRIGRRGPRARRMI